MSQLYVPEGVILVCSQGTTPQPLAVTSQSSIRIAGGRLAATVNDRMCANHNCATLIVGGAIVGAIIAGAVAAATIATGGLAGAALVGACAAGGAAAGAGAGLLTGMIPCICGLLTNNWTIYHPDVLFEKQNALLEKATIPCLLGGTVVIFYSEIAANAATKLNRANTICNVGLVAVTAFGMGLTGAFAGMVTAGKALVTGFTQFGLKIGLMNAGQMALAGGTSYIGGNVLNVGFDFVRNAIGLEKPINTNIIDIMEEVDTNVNNPDKRMADVGGFLDNSKYGNQTSTYKITTQQQYEIYNIRGSGQEHTIVSSTATENTIKPGATIGKSSTSTPPRFDSNIRISDRTGYAESGTRTQTTTGLQNKTDYVGAARRGVAAPFIEIKNSVFMYTLSQILTAVKNPIVKGYIADFEDALLEEKKVKEKSIEVKEDNI